MKNKRGHESPVGVTDCSVFSFDTCPLTSNHDGYLFRCCVENIDCIESHRVNLFLANKDQHHEYTFS